MVQPIDAAYRSTQSPFSGASPTQLASAKDAAQPAISRAVRSLEKDQVLAAALSEYCQLKEEGTAPTAGEFCRRFPTYHKSIQRMIDVEETLDKLDDLDDAAWPEVGSSFMGFDVLHELGVGAFARVYLASEPALGGRLVAVKVAMFGSDEAETLGKLVHPNVVPVHSVRDDLESGMTAVCMPYLGSATLSDVIEQVFQDGVPQQGSSILAAVARREVVVGDGAESSSRDVDESLRRGSYVDAVVRVGIQMAEALAYTHSQGVLHRDLKPSNVLITPAGQPKLLDFNLSCDVETEVNRLGGTLPYMPPEQINDVFLRPFDAKPPTDPRSDLFSLGVILYELLTGQLPFGNPPTCSQPIEAGEIYLRAQQLPPRPLQELNPAIESPTARLIERCISPNPDRRPKDASSLVTELQDHFSWKRRCRRWSANHRKTLVAAGFMMFALLLSLSWHLATRPPLDRRVYDRGLDAMANGDYANAIECFSRALKLKQDALSQGEVNQDERGPDDLNRGERAILLARGLCYQAREDHVLAQLDLFPIARPDDCEPIVKEVYAYSCLESGRTDMSLATIPYTSLLQERPHDLNLKVNLALANFGFTYGEGRIKLGPRRALAKANAIIRDYPTCGPAHHIRAMCMYEKLANNEPVQVADVLQDVETAIALGQHAPDLEKSRMRLLARIVKDDPVAYEAFVAEMKPRLWRIAPLFQRETLERLASSLRLIDDPDWFETVTARCRTTPELKPVKFIATPPSPQAIDQFLEEPWD